MTNIGNQNYVYPQIRNRPPWMNKKTQKPTEEKPFLSLNISKEHFCLHSVFVLCLTGAALCKSREHAIKTKMKNKIPYIAQETIMGFFTTLGVATAVEYLNQKFHINQFKLRKKD